MTGYLKLPDLLDMMSRIIMERNYDAQIEDAFRCFDRKGQGTITRQDFEILFEVNYTTDLETVKMGNCLLLSLNAITS